MLFQKHSVSRLAKVEKCFYIGFLFFFSALVSQSRFEDLSKIFLMTLNCYTIFITFF